MSEKFTEPKEGYDRLARLMGEAPETAIFRRFGALSAEVLLYRQAELVDLEEQLREQQQEDKLSSSEARNLYSRDFRTLRNSDDPDAGDDEDDNQWYLIQRIETKLQIYHKMLLRHRQVLELRNPLRGQVDVLKDWMERPSMGNVYLLGPDRQIWSNPDLEDMVALEPSDLDSVTSDLTLRLVSCYNHVIGRHIHKRERKDFLRNTIRYRKGTFKTLKNLTTLVACLLPIAAISILSSIPRTSPRLGAISVFTAVFSFVLTLTTEASTHETFAATAAFAAVLVVFVGTDGSNCSLSTT